MRTIKKPVMEKEELKNNLKKIFVYHTILIIVTIFLIATPLMKEEFAYMILLLPGIAGIIALYKTTTIYNALLDREL